jgi:hypothetical protein
MDKALETLAKTPLPTILVVAGIIFLFLAIGGRLGARFSSERLKPLYAMVLGLILLGVGISMQMIQGKVNSAEANKDKQVIAQASPSATTAPAQTYALRVPAVKGKVIRTTRRIDMPEMSLSVEAGGKYMTGNGSVSNEKTERLEIMAVEDGRPSVLREKILSDSQSTIMTLEGKTSNNAEKGPLEGATVLVEFKNGRWVRSLMGGTPNKAQNAELQQQFVDPAEIYPTDKVSPGYKWQLKDQQLVHFLSGALSATGDAWCTFTGVELHQDQKCAVISSWLQISFKALVNSNPTEINLGASCTAYRALDKLVDIESSVDGQMTMKSSLIINGSKSTVEIAGPFHTVEYGTDITSQPDFSMVHCCDFRLATLVRSDDVMFWNTSPGVSVQSSKSRRRFSLP